MAAVGLVEFDTRKGKEEGGNEKGKKKNTIRLGGRSLCDRATKIHVKSLETTINGIENASQIDLWRSR